MAKSTKPFILNDENVENSYGFFVSTDGIQLGRFEKNPVMLSDHINGCRSVLGRWADWKKENGLFLAYPDFDTDDPDAALIEGKVERDFIKGASMGLLFSYEDLAYVGGKVILIKSELVEGTIIPVPSNSNALKLYLKGKEDTPLTEAELKSLCLSLSAENPELNFKTDMKKIMLSFAALFALGYKDAPKDGIEESEIESKILTLSGKLTDAEKANETLKAENERLKGEAATTAKTEGTVFLQAAVSQGKIKADQVESYLSLYETNPALVKATIDAIPAKTSLGAVIVPGNATGDPEVKTAEDFMKLSHEAQLSFKANHGDQYNKIFKNK